MREADLQKRRKTAEELLQWHRKLLDEEKKIAELEAAAKSVIKPPPKPADRYRFNGRQLNQLWRNMTGRDDRKFAEDRVYVMSQVALERLCKCARQHSNKSRKVHSKHSDASTEHSASETGRSDSGSAKKAKTTAVQNEEINSTSEVNYSSFFDPESVQDIINSQEEKTKISSISELIDNFSKIEDEISLLSRKSELDITLLVDQLQDEPSRVTETLDTTKPSSQSSVVKTMTPNHVSEPEEVRTTRTQEENLQDETIETVTSSEKEEPEQTEDVASTKATETSVQIDSLSQEDKPSIEDEVATEEITEDLSQATRSVLSSDNKIELSVPLTSLKTTNDTVPEPVTSSKDETTEPGETKESECIKPATHDTGKEALSLDETLQCASKIEECLSKLNERLAEDREEVPKAEESSEKPTEEISEDIQTEDLSTLNEVQSLEATSPSGVSKSEPQSSCTNELEEKTPHKKTSDQIDVKKRVSEILADASSHRGEKSPRVQDLYVTAYDVGAPNLPEITETFEDGRALPTSIFGSEAEELWKKQLAIEQEIKQLEQQQKEQLPYVYMREIPNKPPPPYTPPSFLSSLPQSIVPLSVKEVNEISDYSSKVLFKAYLNNTLDMVKFSENGFKLFSKMDIAKICAEFVFNICRDIAKAHYSQFKKVEKPSWFASVKKPQLAKTKSPNAAELDKILNKKLKELFGFKKVQMTESAIIKWGKKKRDHVDEILVIESQEEESQWTNFDNDELFVKDQITKDIMKLLINETASVFSKILSKKKAVLV